MPIAYRALLVLTLACVTASAQPVARLWPGQWPGGTRLVSPELGCAFSVPQGFTASWSVGGTSVGANAHGIGMALWPMAGVDVPSVRAWIESVVWTGMDGEAMTGAALTPLPGGQLRREFRSTASVGSIQLQLAPGGAAFMVSIWGRADSAAQQVHLRDEVLAGVRHFPPAMHVAGHFGLYWLGMSRGTKLVYYETYSTYDGGYTSKDQLDLCCDGSFSSSGSFSANFGTTGASGAATDSSQGAWGLDAHAFGSCTLLLQNGAGELKRYDLTYDSNSERTYLGNTRYFWVYSEWCPCSDEAWALPPELASGMQAGPGRAPGGARAPHTGADPVPPRPQPGSASAPPPQPAPAPVPQPVPAPEAAPEPPGLDGVWLSADGSYVLAFGSERYEFYLHDGESQYDLADTGRLVQRPRQLAFHSDDDEVESYAYELSGDVLVLQMDEAVRFNRQPADG